MNWLMCMCFFCDLVFVPLLLITKSNGHKINVIFLHQGNEIDRWWFYEPLEVGNLSDRNNRFKRRPKIRAIHLGKKVKCVKGSKKQEQIQLAKVVPRYGTIRLACRICGRQSDQEAMEAKTWFKWTKELEKGGNQVVWRPEEVKMDVWDNDRFNRIATRLDNTLVIKDFRQSDVGTYFCERFSKKALHSKFSFIAPGSGGEESAVNFALVYKRLVGKRDVDFVYHLDIQSQAEGFDSDMVSVNSTGMKKPRAKISDQTNNHVVFTEWGEWSKCSRCREKGEKKRVGNCMVKKLDFKRPSTPEYVDKVLTMYKQGAPCHSSLFQKHKTFHDVTQETQVEVCIIKCTGTKKHDLFQSVRRANDTAIAKDFKSRVKFDVSISDQSGSMLGSGLKNKLKGLKEPIKKNFTQGMKTRLICITRKDKTLKWYKNTTLLLNTELAKHESYRIKISSKGYLKFAEILPRDAGPYKCTFKNGKLTKKWIIKVKKIIKPNWSYYYGMLLISYCITFVVFIILLVIRTTYLISTKKKNFHEQKRKKEAKEGKALLVEGNEDKEDNEGNEDNENNETNEGD